MANGSLVFSKTCPDKFTNNIALQHSTPDAPCFLVCAKTYTGNAKVTVSCILDPANAQKADLKYDGKAAPPLDACKCTPGFPGCPQKPGTTPGKPPGTPTTPGTPGTPTTPGTPPCVPTPGGIPCKEPTASTTTTAKPGKPPAPPANKCAVPGTPGKMNLFLFHNHSESRQIIQERFS